MRKIRKLVTVLMLACVSPVQAQVLIGAQWNPPGSSPTSSGSGSLASQTVTLATSAVGNAGAVFNWNWSGLPFASGHSLSVTNNSGIAIAVGASTTAVQTLTFSSAVSSPYLWFNYIDQNTSFSFGSYDWTLLSANGAARSGNSVNVTASQSNLSDSGFLVRINQDFGPSTSLSFNYISTSSASTSGFTIATVPEPSAFASRRGVRCGPAAPPQDSFGFKIKLAANFRASDLFHFPPPAFHPSEALNIQSRA